MSGLEEKLAHAKYRLEAITSGHKKVSAMLAGKPNSDKADGWKQRIAEYEDGMKGIPIQIAQMEFDLEQRKKRLAGSGKSPGASAKSK